MLLWATWRLHILCKMHLLSCVSRRMRLFVHLWWALPGTTIIAVPRFRHNDFQFSFFFECGTTFSFWLGLSSLLLSSLLLSDLFLVEFLCSLPASCNHTVKLLRRHSRSFLLVCIYYSWFCFDPTSTFWGVQLRWLGGSRHFALFSSRLIILASLELTSCQIIFDSFSLLLSHCEILILRSCMRLSRSWIAVSSVSPSWYLDWSV